MGSVFALLINEIVSKRRVDMTETNKEQTLADIEKAFEDSKAARLISKHRWEANKGKYHCQLVARREAGETMTVGDMRALEAVAIDDIPFVRSAYLAFIDADSAYRSAKVAKDAAVRAYWDCKPGRI